MDLGPEAFPEEFCTSLVQLLLSFSHGWRQLDEKELFSSIIPARLRYLMQIFPCKPTSNLHKVFQRAFSPPQGLETSFPLYVRGAAINLY